MKFNLDFPSQLDVPLAFDLELDKVAPHRVLIYVNGWQFGRYDPLDNALCIG